MVACPWRPATDSPSACPTSDESTLHPSALPPACAQPASVGENLLLRQGTDPARLHTARPVLLGLALKSTGLACDAGPLSSLQSRANMAGGMIRGGHGHSFVIDAGLAPNIELHIH